MDKFLPFLDVSGPDGQQFHVELANARVTIGWFEQFNDVALEPDPQQLITRKVHCAVERDTHGWWVVDNGSVNRTCHLSSAASIRGKRHKSAMSIVINSGLQLNLWMGQEAQRSAQTTTERAGWIRSYPEFILSKECTASRRSIIHMTMLMALL